MDEEPPIPFEELFPEEAATLGRVIKELRPIWHITWEGKGYEKFSKDVNVPWFPMKENRDVGRNDPCVCGSGKKFKSCCMGFDSLIRRLRKISIDSTLKNI